MLRPELDSDGALPFVYFKSNFPSTIGFMDSTDVTKKLALVLTGITTATTVSLTIPNSSGTLALVGGFGGAALTAANDTNVTLATGGTPNTALLVAASITAGWTGTLSTARGGTGAANLNAFALIASTENITGSWTFTPATGSGPVFKADSVSGGLPYIILFDTSTANQIALVSTALTGNRTVTIQNTDGTMSLASALLNSVNHTDTTTDTVARGDVITGQGASAKWVRLAKGTSKQVLSGDGTDTAWASLDNTYLPDRTRYVSLNVGDFNLAAGGATSFIGTEPNAISRHFFATGADTSVYVEFVVPADYSSGAMIKAHISSNGASTNAFILKLYTKVVSAGTDLTGAADNTDTFTNVTPSAQNLLLIPTVTITTTLAAGNIIRFAIQRNGTADTNTSGLNLHGASFQYTADS